MAQELVIREGFLFLKVNNDLPLEGVFVEHELDSSKSVLLNMLNLDGQNDTGILVPLFHLIHTTGSHFTFELSQAIPFENEVTGNGQPADLGRILPVRLTFKYFGATFSNPYDSINPLETGITYNNKKILSHSWPKPSNWGMLIDLQIVPLASN